MPRVTAAGCLAASAEVDDRLDPPPGRRSGLVSRVAGRLQRLAGRASVPSVAHPAWRTAPPCPPSSTRATARGRRADPPARRSLLETGFPGGTYSGVFYVAGVDAAGPAADGEIHVEFRSAAGRADGPLAPPAWRSGRSNHGGGLLVGRTACRPRRQKFRWQGRRPVLDCHDLDGRLVGWGLGGGPHALLYARHPLSLPGRSEANERESLFGEHWAISPQPRWLSQPLSKVVAL